VRGGAEQYFHADGTVISNRDGGQVIQETAIVQIATLTDSDIAIADKAAWRDNAMFANGETVAAINENAELGAKEWRSRKAVDIEIPPITEKCDIKHRFSLLFSSSPGKFPS
jgi:hypothetical protein